MRFFAIILALYTSALSLIPCNDVHGEHESIPLTVQAAQDRHEEDQDLCSPYCLCSCCQGFVMIAHGKQPSQIQLASKPHFSFYKDHLTAEVTHDHWQPPR